MESNDLITILTVVLSVLSVVLSGVFGVRTTRLAHTLDPNGAAPPGSNFSRSSSNTL